MTTCKMCGNCCVIPGTNKDCKHLIRLKSGRTLCRVFKTRIGRVIGEMKVNDKVFPVKCLMREDVKQNYDGCPFNEDNS